MRRFFFFPLLLAVIGPAQSSGASDSHGLAARVPDHDAPQELIEVWLRFHEKDWCQDVDAVFAFEANGMDVWCLVEDERSYQRLEVLLSSLNRCCRTALYTTRPTVEKKSAGDRDPPPSLWQNYALRSYLGDPFVRASEFRSLELRAEMDISFYDESLKQRLLAYAEQIIEWDRQMKRYALELPALTAVATDPAFEPELRSKANAVSMAHSRDMNKRIKKLANSLSHAFPGSFKKERRKTEKSSGSVQSPVEIAVQLSRTAQNVAGRVRGFIHAEKYTAGLDELRQPGLLQALWELEQMDLAFQKSLAKSGRK